MNALDHPGVEMVAPPSDSTVLPEFPSEAIEFAAERPSEPRPPSGFLTSAGVNPWPEIRRRLTVRQFEIFEYVYRLQMTVADVTEVTGLQKNAVYRILNAAKTKLRKSLKRKNARRA